MAECLHCEINALVERHEEAGEQDLVTLAAKIVESLVDIVVTAPPDEQDCWSPKSSRSSAT